MKLGAMAMALHGHDGHCCGRGGIAARSRPGRPSLGFGQRCGVCRGWPAPSIVAMQSHDHGTRRCCPWRSNIASDTSVMPADFQSHALSQTCLALTARSRLRPKERPLAPRLSAPAHAA